MSQVLTRRTIVVEGPQHSAIARRLAEELARQASVHKSEIRKHRRGLQACTEELAKLRAMCAQLGIRLDVVGPSTNQGVEETHGHRTAQPQHR